MSITGDYGTLERWADDLQKIASQEFARRVSLKFGVQSLKFIREGFKKQSDPFGKQWTAKVKPDGRKILHGETDKLNASWQLEQYGPTGFVIMSAVPYALPHQFGASKRGTGWSLPRRPMTPDNDLPNRWIDSFDKIFSSEIIKIIDRGW